MGSVRFAACCVGLVACLVTAGCGGGSATTAGSSVVDASGTTTSPSTGGGVGGATSGGGDTAGTTGTTGDTGGRAIHEPVQSRGIKGEDPSAEAATSLRISAADCGALARLAERRLGTHLTQSADPSPPLSRCRLSGSGTEINVFLDSGFAAHQRYSNRIAETVQFNTENPEGLPQPVPGVGEKAAYNADASWIPALSSLLAVRGNRWLTVTIAVAGRSDRELREEAAVLARAGFKLTAVG